MARVPDRNLDKGHFNFSEVPNHPPLPPPSDWLDTRDRQWERNPEVCEGDHQLVRHLDRNTRTGFRGNAPAGRGHPPYFMGGQDVLLWGRGNAYRRPGRQMQIAYPVQHVGLSKKFGFGKDDPPLPPTPPRGPPAPVPLDLPVDGRPRIEYRRFDDYDEDPRLRAELYPLEGRQSQRFGRARIRQDAFYDRNYDDYRRRSDLNLSPSQRMWERSRSQGRLDSCEDDWYRDDYDSGGRWSRNAVTRGADQIWNAGRYPDVNWRASPRERSSSRSRQRSPPPVRGENRRSFENVVSDGRSRGGGADSDASCGSKRKVVIDVTSCNSANESKEKSGSDKKKKKKKKEKKKECKEKVKKKRGFFGRKKKSKVEVVVDTAAVEMDDVERRSLTDTSKPQTTTRSPRGYRPFVNEPGPYSKPEGVYMPGMNEEESEFHELVASGNLIGVRRFLIERPNFDINCLNHERASALHVAIRQSDESMVNFLLSQPDLEYSDCALVAIRDGNLRIVESIFYRMQRISPNMEFAPISHSIDFSDDITPLILAAQLGKYEIIEFLLKRNHCIPPVHNSYCTCQSCKEEILLYDRLKYSTVKLNLYKAICNPMYIFQVTDDPIDRAFELKKEVEDAAKVFPHFRNSYGTLWEALKKFPVDLLDCCQNAQEVEIILKKCSRNVTGSLPLPRLQYALDLKQREFVSHPFTQAVILDTWTGDLYDWKVRSSFVQTLSVFSRILMLPAMAIVCMFLPNHRFVKKWKIPVNKMISSVASYLLFLVILFLESNLDKKNQKRGPPNSGLEGIIIIYVIGLIGYKLRICFRLGPRRFFSIMWHWYDCVMLLLFTITFVFWIASLADVTANGDIDLARKYWNSLDPELIAEGFFACAVIMAFFRLNMYLFLHHYVGPLQVSIGKMTVDILRFLILIGVMIFAWSAGLCRFYQPYDGMTQKDSSTGSTIAQVKSFTSFKLAFKTFFWAIFGLSPIESADVIIENLPGDCSETTIINHHGFTETIGYIAFALFQFLSVIVILNVMVACMASTFTKSMKHVGSEWIFGKSEIYMSYMVASTLPPPLNLLPTASGFKNGFDWLFLLVKSRDRRKAKCSISHCCYIDSEEEPYVNTEFPHLMTALLQRYIRMKNRINETLNEHLEIKRELSSIRRKLDRLLMGPY